MIHFVELLILLVGNAAMFKIQYLQYGMELIVTPELYDPQDLQKVKKITAKISFTAYMS